MFAQKLKFIFPWILFATLVYILHYPAFWAYFFQDDWFSFLSSRINSIKELPKLFQSYSHLIYYRPLGMQVPFFLSRLLFDLNPLPFRITTFFIHLLNGWLVFRLLKLFNIDKHLRLVGAFLYLTSASHYTIFYWAATFAFVLSPLIYFSAFWSYAQKRYKLSLGIFLLGLFVNELVITLPMVLLSWEVYQKRKLKINPNLPFWLGSVIFTLFRFTIAPFTKSDSYAFLTHIRQLMVNIRNYTLWAFNWAETIQDQFISFLVFNPEFIKNFKSYVLVLIIATATTVFVLVILPLIKLRMEFVRSQTASNNIVFGIIWFLVTLAPVLFFAHHFFSYYIPIPLFGLLISGLSLFHKLIVDKKLPTRRAMLLLSVVGGVWYLSSYYTFKLNAHIHWAPRRAHLAQKLRDQLMTKFPNLPDKAVVIIKHQYPGWQEEKWALSDQKAVQILYDNSTLTTFYGTKEDYIKFKNKQGEEANEELIYVLL